MTWAIGGSVRCKSATYAGRFVVEGGYVPTFWDDWCSWQITVGGNARQRRKVVRRMKRGGFRVIRGGVSK